MTEYNIAIVGGGANSVCVINELVKQLAQTQRTQNFKITVFEKSGKVGAGLAYGTNMDAHILNMAASTMSAVANKPGDFLRWLQKPHSPDLHPYFNTQAQGHDFVPRKIFGFYLQELLETAVKKAIRFGIHVEFVQAEITDISLGSSDIWLKAGNTTQRFDQGFLCLGNQPPTVASQLNPHSGYFHEPWPVNTITENIPKDEDVFIIGTSLTAIDAFLTLKESGHTGKITLISRRGLLPKVRAFSDPYTLTCLDPEEVKAVTATNKRKLCVQEAWFLFKQEFENAGIDIESIDLYEVLSSKSPQEILTEDIDKAKSGSLPYFSVLKALDEVIGELWNEMSIEARQFFDAHYKTLWNAYDYPMPLQNAEKLLSAFQSGQLSVLDGLRNVRYSPENDGFELICADKDSDNISFETYKTRYVINAAGYGLDLQRIQNPFIQNALMRGVITPHLLGGIDVDFKTGGVRDKSGFYSKRLFAVGSLTRGVHFYTNSIQENAKAARWGVQRAIQTTLEDAPASNPSLNFQPKGGTNE